MKRTKHKQKDYTIDPDKFFNREERNKLLRYCRDQSELDLLHGRRIWVVRYMLIDLAFYSGLRVAEMAALKISDIRLKDEMPCLVVRHGKGDRKRFVYLDNGVVQHLNTFIKLKQTTLKEPFEGDVALFTGKKENHSKPLTLMKAFKSVIREIGLREELSIHSCRHTYATFLLHDTKNMKYVQRQLGHKNISMTALYSGILPEENSKLANQIKRDFE